MVHLSLDDFYFLDWEHNFLGATKLMNAFNNSHHMLMHDLSDEVGVHLCNSPIAHCIYPLLECQI
uniref:Uncharacterized protein n=1 Tax=Arion vulgaris TaxID=1028688 RepID=A0A0B6Y035_9EUPU